MYASAQSTWGPRLATFALSLLAAGSVVYWGLKLSASSRPVAVQPAQAAGPQPVDAQALARLLGGGAQPATAAAPAPSASSRFALAGVITEGAHAGAALIAVDGKPAKPFRVGAKVDDNLVLQSVAPRSVSLGGSVDGPASITLELPRKP